MKVNSPGQDRVRYLLGSVEYPWGDGLYELYPKKRNEEVQQHLEHLLEREIKSARWLGSLRAQLEKMTPKQPPPYEESATARPSS